MVNPLPSEQVAVLGTIDPDATGASTVVSDYTDLGKFESIMVVVMTGTLGASATVDAVIKQATDSSGTGAKDLTTSKAITQLVKASNDDDQAIINVRAEDLDMANDFRYAAVSLTVGTATSDVAAIILGINPRFGPASDNDLDSVVEIVS